MSFLSSAFLASWRQQERKAREPPANNHKPRKKQKKVLVLMSVSLHEKVSHTFPALHAALVPSVMLWILQEKDDEKVGVRLKDGAYVTELPAFLREGKHLPIPEHVMNSQCQFYLDGEEVSRD